MKKLLLTLLFTGCTTTYTVTHDNGNQKSYNSREKAIEYHDQENYRKPLSVRIDSIKIK